MNRPLSGIRVAVPESRELDLFARMLEDRGARTLRCPLITIRDTPDQSSVEQWLTRFVKHPPFLLILLTGEGLNRLLSAAERIGCLDAFRDALGRTQTLTRGPKPGRALRTIDLRPDLVATSPTTDGVIESLASFDLSGKRVGVQLYGQEPNPQLLDALTRAGADYDTVSPYIYASDTDDPQVVSLMDAMIDGGVDVIAFTSKAQVRRLFAIADAVDRRGKLVEALKRIRVAAVGPVVADMLSEYGVPVNLQPRESYFMKPLIRELIADVTGGQQRTEPES